ncbi:MAG: hypothetical protein ACXWBH_09540 [Candidatus Angelobacter sp.]
MQWHLHSSVATINVRDRPMHEAQQVLGLVKCQPAIDDRSW